MNEGRFSWPALAEHGGASAAQAALDGALAEARERGYAEGHQQALAELAETRTALLASLAELQAAKAALADDYQAAITDLAFSAARALLRVELIVNPDVLSGLVAQALEILDAKLEAVGVCVNPEDASWLPEETPIPVVVDETVPPGGLAVTLPDLSVEFDLIGRLREQFEASGRDDDEPAIQNV